MTDSGKRLFIHRTKGQVLEVEDQADGDYRSTEVHSEYTHATVSSDFDTAFYCDEVEHYDFHPESGMPFFLVVVNYGTGDTFGHTDGQLKAVAAMRHLEDAKKLARAITRDEVHPLTDRSTPGTVKTTDRFLTLVRHYFGLNPQHAYKDWEGHFESFLWASVIPMTIQ